MENIKNIKNKSAVTFIKDGKVCKATQINF